MAFLCLPFITINHAAYTYEPKTPIHLLNFKLKHELNFMNFPRCTAS